MSSNFINSGYILIKNIEFKKNGTSENLSVNPEITRMIEVLEDTETIREITRYGYDNNGNQIYKATEIIEPIEEWYTETITAFISGEGGDSGICFNEYDGFNQLIKTTIGDKTITYAYNGDGLRIRKNVNGADTVQVWDGDQIALELNGAGNVSSKYVRGINLLYSEDGSRAGARTWYLFNGHGDVVQLTNNTGSLIKTYDYDAFGNEKNPDPSDTNPFRYCGEYFDKETGTIYLRARYYDPATSKNTCCWKI